MCAWVLEAYSSVIYIYARRRRHRRQVHCMTLRSESCLHRRCLESSRRFTVVILGALEGNVASLDTPIFWRVLSWWMLLQSWATLRFDDHRGMVPSDLVVSENGLVGRLTRSKVSGPDKKLNYRLLIVHSSAYVQHKDWLVSGWELLKKEAPYSRDYLLPAPSNNFRVFKKEGTEVRYSFRHTIADHIVAILSRAKTFPSEHWSELGRHSIGPKASRSMRLRQQDE